MKENDGARSLRRFLEILLVILVTLRLAGVIRWPWAAVLAPLWVPLALYVITFAVVLVAFAIERHKMKR